MVKKVSNLGWRHRLPKWSQEKKLQISKDIFFYVAIVIIAFLLACLWIMNLRSSRKAIEFCEQEHSHEYCLANID